jgi:hypothetical protein
MGVLTNFVVANAEDAEAIGTSTALTDEFLSVKAEGLDAHKLGRLYTIVSRTGHDDTFMKDPTHKLYTSPSGVEIQLVPSELVLSLCQIPDMGLPSIAKSWGETDGFDAAWTPEAIESALQNFSGVCREALGEGKALMMYIS